MNKINSIFLIGMVEDIKQFSKDNGTTWSLINLKVLHDIENPNLGCNWFRVSSFKEQEILIGNWICVEGRLSVYKGKDEKYKTQITAFNIVNLNKVVNIKLPKENSNKILDELKERLEEE